MSFYKEIPYTDQVHPELRRDEDYFVQQDPSGMIHGTTLVLEESGKGVLSGFFIREHPDKHKITSILLPVGITSEQEKEMWLDALHAVNQPSLTIDQMIEYLQKQYQILKK